MWVAKGKTAIVGVGVSELTRKPEKALGSSAIEACKRAVEDAGLSLSDIDGLASFPEAPFIGGGIVDGEDVVTPSYMLNHMKLADSVRWYCQLEAGMITAAVIEACNALVAGACNYVLLWRALHIPKGAYGAVQSSTNLVEGLDAFTIPYGFATPLQLHALTYRRYMDLYGAKREHMATLAVTQRRYANKNEKAIFYEKQLTVENYLNSRMVADPLCLLDCDVPVEGCLAVVLTTYDRAKDVRNRPAYIAAYGLNTCRKLSLVSYTLEDYFDNNLGRQIWENSGYSPRDVDIAEIYDGFLPSVWYGLEAYGFCSRGEAFEFIQNGRIDQDGELPLNTNGGACSEGRLHAMGHLVEAVLQVTGRASPRQVNNVHIAFVAAGSPMLRNSALLITRDPQEDT